jgi:hypothetical protein
MDILEHKNVLSEIKNSLGEFNSIADGEKT